MPRSSRTGSYIGTKVVSLRRALDALNLLAGQAGHEADGGRGALADLLGRGWKEEVPQVSKHDLDSN